MPVLTFDGPLDLRGTLRPLSTGFGDPTWRLDATRALRTTRTPDGPATLGVEVVGPGRVRTEAWGAGADWALERAAELIGLEDVLVDPATLPRALRPFAKRARGVRLPRTHRVVELLVPIALQQKVSGKEAARAFRNLVRAFSERAPGPWDDLWLPLGPEALRDLPLARLPPLGVPERQGALLRRIGRRAGRLEEADGMTPDAAERRLRALDGIGPWSAASALLRGMGGADAVPVGDYNLPRLVAWNLAGESRADDARMLALLEPYRGFRGRVLCWLATAGRMPPRRGPRRPLRSLPSAPGFGTRGPRPPS